MAVVAEGGAGNERELVEAESEDEVAPKKTELLPVDKLALGIPADEPTSARGNDVPCCCCCAPGVYCFSVEFNSYVSNLTFRKIA